MLFLDFYQALIEDVIFRVFCIDNYKIMHIIIFCNSYMIILQNYSNWYTFLMNMIFHFISNAPFSPEKTYALMVHPSPIS